MLGQTTGIIAGAAGLAFLGYCIYFDRKRRSAPDYQEKIRQRRSKQRQGGSCGAPSAQSTKMQPEPPLTDQAAVQQYFLSEIQVGEEKLSMGLVDEGVAHLTNAIRVCGQPQQLLQVLHQTLPPEIFQKLTASLPTIAALHSSQGGSCGAPSAQSTKMQPEPPLTDQAAVQQSFVSEIQVGEEKLSMGLVDEGVAHLTNAIRVCGQPQQLLRVLHQTLPPEIFQKLTASLPTIAAARRPAPVVEEVEDEMD